MKKEIRVTEGGRECTKCNEFLPWMAFSKNKNGANGHNSQCKDCWKVHTNKHKTPSTTARDAERLAKELERRSTMTDQELRQEYLERKAQWKKEWDAIDWPALHAKVAKELTNEE